MNYELSARAQRDLREHLYFLAAEDWRIAAHEAARIHYAIGQFAGLPLEGIRIEIHRWPRPVYRWPLDPFMLYYERRPSALFVIRLYHSARRPIERT